VKQLASQAELSPFSSPLDGKWFIARMGSSNVADFKTYYFIITSANKRIIMYGGCNVNFSTYSFNGNQVSFTAPAGTRKACLNDNDKQVMDPLLRNANYVEASQELLFFYDSKLGESIVLTTTPPSS
jgi:heat shock protein HslJ